MCSSASINAIRSALSEAKKSNFLNTYIISLLLVFILTSTTEFRVCAELVVALRGRGTSSFLTVRVNFVWVVMVLSKQKHDCIKTLWRRIFCDCKQYDTDMTNYDIVGT